jgi:hypothetical protein
MIYILYIDIGRFLRRDIFLITLLLGRDIASINRSRDLSMGKLYLEKETRGSRKASHLYRALEVLEYVEEDLGCDDPHIKDLPESEDEIDIYVSRCGVSEHILKEGLRELEEMTGFKIRIIRSTGYGSGIKDLYRSIGDLVKRDMLDLLKPLALETARRGGIEYMAILLKSGSWIILEGERHRVRVPWIEEAIAIAHTHPPEGCIPSRPDLESCLELLSSGGIACGVISVKCFFIIQLGFPLSIECYEHLMRIVNKYEDILEEVRSAESFIQIFRERCDSLKLTLSPL